MYVSVRYFQSQHADTYTLARDSGLHGQCHFLRKLTKSEISLVVQVENIVVLHIFRNDKGMSLYQRIDVQKSIVIFILGNLE